MKNIYMLILISLLFIALVIGCSPVTNEYQTINEDGDIGDTGGLKLPITHNENVTISMLVETSTPNRSESLAIKELSRRTGVNIKTIETPFPSLREKVKVLIAGGEIPDILISEGMNFREINQLGIQGAFVAVNKYIDKLPNFKRIFVDNKENSWIFKSLTAADGNLYYWPKYEVSRPVNHGFLYRKDIFDKHDIKMWSNTEEFYQALKKLKEIYPDSTPLVSKNKENIFSQYAIGWGLVGDTTYYNEEEGMWKPIFTDSSYKQVLDFLKKLYNEKLLDPEFISDTQASWTAKMTQKEKAFVTFDWIGRLDMFYGQVKSVIPEYDLRFAYPIGSKARAVTQSKIGLNGYGSLVANNENKELSLLLLDYITSDSGTELLTMGIKDVNYKQTEDGKILYPEFPENRLIGIKDLEDKYGLFLAGTYTRIDKRSIYFQYSEKEQEAQDMIINSSRFEPMDPILSFTTEELKLIDDCEVNLKTAFAQFSTRYVMDASYGEVQWQEWITHAERLGANKLADIYNDAQTRHNND